MSMRKVFIWLSGLRFSDNKKLVMARNCFLIFTENNHARGTGKKYNIPDVNCLILYLKNQSLKVSAQCIV